jgi:hypothetical protein
LGIKIVSSNLRQFLEVILFSQLNLFEMFTSISWGVLE